MDPCVMTVADPSIFLQAAACINISVAFVQSGTQIPVNIPVERCHLSLCPDSSSGVEYHRTVYRIYRKIIHGTVIISGQIVRQTSHICEINADILHIIYAQIDYYCLFHVFGLLLQVKEQLPVSSVSCCLTEPCKSLRTFADEFNVIRSLASESFLHPRSSGFAHKIYSVILCRCVQIRGRIILALREHHHIIIP